MDGRDCRCRGGAEQHSNVDTSLLGLVGPYLMRAVIFLVSAGIVQYSFDPFDIFGSQASTRNFRRFLSYSVSKKRSALYSYSSKTSKILLWWKYGNVFSTDLRFLGGIRLVSEKISKTQNVKTFG